ncbi:multiple organellar RNA editing factor 9, chloroplastic [Eucalyptus grandis]|uniref:multiple organellar RNA editing factor 9, chloroplastic n=1 Tax=Eucalyptus grandis TaxID=71139 RepID=UPI00192EF0CF|nr:multiple organellar RNA editing factor 9, chloroplastic [Eucalyptus grandis]
MFLNGAWPISSVATRHAPPPPTLSIQLGLFSTETSSLHRLHRPPSPLPPLLSVAPLSIAPAPTSAGLKRNVGRFGPALRVPVPYLHSLAGELRLDLPRAISSGDGATVPGRDHRDWLVVMIKPGGDGATKQRMIDCHVETLARVAGRLYAKRKQIRRSTMSALRDALFLGVRSSRRWSNKLGGLPWMLFVIPESYVNPEYKDCGGELFVNGKIVQRSPERQRDLSHNLR